MSTRGQTFLFETVPTLACRPNARRPSAASGQPSSWCHTTFIVSRFTAHLSEHLPARCCEHAVEDLLAPRETPEDLGAREGRVHEEADGGVWERLTEQRRDEEQVVVVDPDQVSGPGHLRDARREGDVDVLVRGPVRVRRGVLRCDVLPKQIVEQRPERYVQ